STVALPLLCRPVVETVRPSAKARKRWLPEEFFFCSDDAGWPLNRLRNQFVGRVVARRTQHFLNLASRHAKFDARKACTRDPRRRKPQHEANGNKRDCSQASGKEESLAHKVTGTLAERIHASRGCGKVAVTTQPRTYLRAAASACEAGQDLTQA